MNTIFVFMPIILLILIVGFIVMINKVMSSRRKKYLSGQKIRMVLGIYITILLISMGVYYLIPTDSKSSPENIVDRSFPYLTEKIHNGSTEKLDDTYISKQWNFEYDASTLNIKEYNAGELGSVYVMKKSEDDNQINVVLYETPTYLEGMDISDEIKPPQIYLSSGTMSIGYKQEREIKYTAFKPELTISQFTGEDPMGIENTMTRGEQILIIKVPKGLEIQEGEGMWIEYLEEQ